jgi:predicted nucleic acid-binding protein
MNRSIANASKLYIDSNVLIYLIEGLEPFAGLAARTFEIAGRAGALVVTSELSAAECMIRPFRERNAKLIRSYERLFEDENDIIRLPVEYGIIKSAAEIGGELRLKLADAIHLASAMAAGCEVFVTNDKDIPPPRGIEIMRLSQLEPNP